MANILFKTHNDITNKWLFYIENEAKSLAQRDEFAIQNFLDREIYNPEVEEYLKSSEAQNLLDPIPESESLTLNLNESLHSKSLPNWLSPRFKKLKTKVKEVFCTVVRSIEDINIKDIIKAVLIALIPVFASGLPAAILPILIGLIAYLLKYGMDKTCPI